MVNGLVVIDDQCLIERAVSFAAPRRARLFSRGGRRPTPRCVGAREASPGTLLRGAARSDLHNAANETKCEINLQLKTREAVRGA